MMCAMVSDAEKRRVGALIRTRRQQLGWRQPALAARVGVSRNAVSTWETGRAYPARWAGKVEEVLGISLAANGTAPPPADPRDRELFDLLLRQIEDMTPAEALAIIRDDKQRRERRRTA